MTAHTKRDFCATVFSRAMLAALLQTTRKSLCVQTPTARRKWLPVASLTSTECGKHLAGQRAAVKRQWLRLVLSCSDMALVLVMHCVIVISLSYNHNIAHSWYNVTPKEYTRGFMSN